VAESTKKTWWSLLLSALAMFFGAIGVFTGEFWFPSHHMKRGISGPPARVMGGLFLVFGLLGILIVIHDLAGVGDESSHREERPIRHKGEAKKAVVRKPQPDEEAAAEYLGLNTEERSRGEAEP
jgi:hypothetical protein